MQLAAHLNKLLAAPVLVAAPQAVASSPSSAGFTTFLVAMPYATTFSRGAEVQVILATLPLIALGVLGVAFAAFQISIARMNRTFLDLFLAFGAVFAAGILQLSNVLLSELQGLSSLTRTLLIGEGIALSAFVSFKFLFLHRRSQQPGQREVVDRMQAGEKRRSWRVGGTEADKVVHSGLYKRWGTLGDFLRVGVYLAIVTVGLLEGVWHIGFALVSFKQVVPAYIASHAIQIVLLAFFAIKLVVSAAAVKAIPLYMNFVDILPTLFGIAIATGIAITNLLPHLTGFSSTPLGRFLILVEMFSFLLSMAIQDYQRPYSDDFSFDRRSSTSSLASFHSQLRLTVSNTQSEPELPERITIRKTSRPPSWFSGKRPPVRKIATERESLAAGAMPPARSTTDVESGVPIDAGSMYFDEGSNEVHQQEEQIRFRGTARDSFPTSARQSHDEETRITFTGGNYVVPSPGSFLDPFRSPLPSSSLAPPRRTSRALPSLPSAARSMTAFYARRISSSSGPPPMRTPPPPSMPMPPIPSAPPSAEFFQRLGSKPVAILPTVLVSPIKTSPHPSLASQLRPSPRQSELSSARTEVSLSMFPPPPASVTVQSEYDHGAPSPDFATSHPSMATTGYATHGGAHFDLYPSRPNVLGGVDVRYDITSMIVGLPSGPPRRPSIASSVGSPGLSGEVGVIQHATRITSPSLSRNGSLDPPTRQHPFSRLAVPSPANEPTPSPLLSTGSPTAYDPTKPFERPRPAPIVVGRPAFPASVAFGVGGGEILRKAGGAGKKIVLVRDQEVE